MRTWLERWWYLGGLVVIAMVIAAIVFLAIPVVAAPEAKAPEVFDCVMIAKTVAHAIYRCEDEEFGAIFYMNELGLPMIPWEG